MVSPVFTFASAEMDCADLYTNKFEAAVHVKLCMNKTQWWLEKKKTYLHGINFWRPLPTFVLIDNFHPFNSDFAPLRATTVQRHGLHAPRNPWAPPSSSSSSTSMTKAVKELTLPNFAPVVMEIFPAVWSSY